jgi:3-phenylpropionate/trans-cinnamate dioxygenase ferredoxin reductase component
MTIADERTFVIVGAGPAGGAAAETLRDENFAGRIVLLGDEPEPPYERPPLSKGLLLGSAGRDSVHLHDRGWYVKHDIELRTGTRVDAVDRERRRVRLGDGADIAYDRLLLATGAAAVPLPVGGVLQLRTLADSDRVSAVIRDGGRLVIVGAGWIGLEVAAAARQRGAEVTVVETAPLPLHRVLGDRLAGFFADLHVRHGVEFHFGQRVRRISRTGPVSQVLLDDGTVLPADAVLVAIGVTPNTALAEAAGLAVDNGILVDHRLRTGDPDVFAAGDVANLDHPLLGARIRVEHWQNALDTGATAARAMLGHDVRHDRLPFFFTDQYDLGMEYTGWVPPGGEAELVIRGDLGAAEFIAFWTDRGRVLAGMNVNVWDVTDQIQALIRAGLATGATVDTGRLADPAVPLEELVR